jgi:2'-5' RNA ligase
MARAAYRKAFYPRYDASVDGTQPELARRVLVVVVRGEMGARIQAWREAHDARRAQLLPPHMTLCYRAPHVPDELTEAQVRYAFPVPVVVRLGGVTELPNRDRTLVVEVLDAAELDQARKRLFDATYTEMGGYREWPWHITWVRYGVRRDSAALLALAEHDLRFDAPWTIDAVSLLELQAGRYEPIAEWQLGRGGIC